MKTTLCKLILALATTAVASSAQAGVLTFQDVVFTTNWSQNVLTLEIDAAKRSGDWTQATMLGAIGIKEVGRFDSVSLIGAPTGAAAWEVDSSELNANGCKGGGNNGDGKVLCLYGAPIRLADNMLFRFAFTGTPDLGTPHLKVNFLDSRGDKVGSLMSLDVPAGVAPPPPDGPPVPPTSIPEPQTFALMLAGLAVMAWRRRR